MRNPPILWLECESSGKCNLLTIPLLLFVINHLYKTKINCTFILICLFILLRQRYLGGSTRITMGMETHQYSWYCYIVWTFDFWTIFCCQVFFLKEPFLRLRLTLLSILMNTPLDLFAWVVLVLLSSVMIFVLATVFCHLFNLPCPLVRDHDRIDQFL